MIHIVISSALSEHTSYVTIYINKGTKSNDLAFNSLDKYEPVLF